MTISKPKLIITGYARHGKDTVSEIFSKDHGYSYITSSMYCAKNVVFPVLGPLYGYDSYEECFLDRSNHRRVWYTLINDYNKNDKTRLGREILSHCDIYCGLRNREDLIALREKNIVDYVIWVDRSKHLKPEPYTSNTITPDLADYTIDNNYDLETLKKEVFRVKFSIEMEYYKWNIS